MLFASILPDEWPFPPYAFLVVEFVLLFITGCAVGSLLNVCIYRLAWEKSILWPLQSYCGTCYQPIRWYDNLPIVSYLLLRGRCRTCGTRFSSRYFFVELLTGLGFVALFYLHAIRNVYGLEALNPKNLVFGEEQIQAGLIPLPAWLLFGFHALLFCFLVVASFIDIDHMEIPIVVTGTGTFVGLVAGALLWPHLPAEAPATRPLAVRPAPGSSASVSANHEPHPGIYPAPVWDRLPDWLPADSWKTGLATGMAGVVAGTLMLRGMRFAFAKGRGMEGLGVGDADLMMMAGAFVGWQATVVALFVAVPPALFFGIAQLVRKGDHPIPFGPSLAIGVLATALGWQWVPPVYRSLFYEWILLAVVGGGAVLFLFLAAICFRLVRGQPGPPGGKT